MANVNSTLSSTTTVTRQMGNTLPVIDFWLLDSALIFTQPAEHFPVMGGLDKLLQWGIPKQKTVNLRLASVCYLYDKAII